MCWSVINSPEGRRRFGIRAAPSRERSGKEMIMKKKSTTILALAGAVILAAGSLAGCGSNAAASSGQTDVTSESASQTSRADAASAPTDQASQADASGQEESLSGSILMVGSTSMETLATALAEGYMELHPEVTVSAEFVGSGAGIEAVLGGTADIGNSSRNLKEEEKAAGAVENVVAIDGIAVCVDPANTASGLTKQQLIDIYTGKVTNWAQAGGADVPIVVVGREAGSGTRSAFEEILGIEDQCAYANELDSTGAVMAKVASTPGAIGYVSLDVVDDTVTALPLDGVEATAENIKAGGYFLSRPFVMATMGDVSSQSPLVQDWFAYVLGEEGQAIASSVGLITVE